MKVGAILIIDFPCVLINIPAPGLKQKQTIDHRLKTLLVFPLRLKHLFCAIRLKAFESNKNQFDNFKFSN